jgi:AcrR family transcriptional regulator
VAFRNQSPVVKKQRIIEAAALIFAQKGYARAAVADIAIKAEIGKGTIYEYFQSKEDLFFDVFKWFMWQTSAAAKVNISVLGGSAAERLRALNDSIMGMWDQIEDAFTLTLEFWAASSSSQMRGRIKEAFRAMYEQFRAIVVTILQDGMNRGEFRPNIRPESIAAALVGTWDALFLQAWFDEEFDQFTVAEDFLDIVIQGLSNGHSKIPAKI